MLAPEEGVCSVVGFKLCPDVTGFCVAFKLCTFNPLVVDLVTSRASTALSCCLLRLLSWSVRGQSKLIPEDAASLSAAKKFLFVSVCLFSELTVGVASVLLW